MTAEPGLPHTPRLRIHALKTQPAQAGKASKADALFFLNRSVLPESKKHAQLKLNKDQPMTTEFTLHDLDSAPEGSKGIDLWVNDRVNLFAVRTGNHRVPFTVKLNTVTVPATDEDPNVFVKS